MKKAWQNNWLRACIRRVSLLVAAGALTLLMPGCKMYHIAGSSLTDVQFVIFPHVVVKGGIYYLQYQVKTPSADGTDVLRLLDHKVVKGDACYYFGPPLSRPESGGIVERPVRMDGFTDQALRHEIYWLNKDGSEVKLEFIKE